MYVFIYCVGFPTSVKRILKEYNEMDNGKVFESPPKHYKESRTCIHVNDFDKAAIRRKIHQMHSRKIHVTLNNLLTELKKDDLFKVL